MLILGIDPGLAKIGWGVINIGDAQKRHIANGNLRTSAHEEHITRLRQINNEVSAVVKQWQPMMACVERVFFNVNAKSSLAIGEARGVILATLFTADIKVIEFSALQIKQSLTGAGRANKQQVAQMVGKILNMDVSNLTADATDALACALTATPLMNLGDKAQIPHRLRRTRRRRRA